MSNVGDIYYRYSGRADNDSAWIHCQEWKVIKVTDCGAWIVIDAVASHVGYDLRFRQLSEGEISWKQFERRMGARFVLDCGRRKHAYPVKVDAWDSFVIRSARRLEHLRRQAKNAMLIWERASEQCQTDMTERMSHIANGTTYGKVD